ncbi:tetratricopeptide repeat protein [Pandoraea terrae]|uniref:Tetratricopeptide repeat protein n=1 Tax=Pandoraea terrae TaxID=1537710 RepID=A0A5E4ZCL7_9BURK|nr:tetratricopeptide repeat protein [Pandoraea terrae]VVE59019.1 tetratricopeptide repeat protein [Pandoraea terrae]
MTDQSRFYPWSFLRRDTRLATLALAIAAGFATGAASLPAHAQALPTPAPTPELQTPQQQSESAINKLAGARRYDDALKAAEAHIKQYPRDAQVRFTRARMLMELNRRPEAIDAFVALTQDFPELPEPYNNLAALYAQQGDYEKARADLEMAIRTNPNFAVAYANLGDVYAKLAQQAYAQSLRIAPTARVRDKAAQLDRMLGGPVKAPAKAMPASATGAANAGDGTASKTIEAKPAPASAAVAH